MRYAEHMDDDDRAELEEITEARAYWRKRMVQFWDKLRKRAKRKGEK